MLLPTCLPPASMFLKPLALCCNAARPVPAHFIKPQYGFAFSGSEETLMCLFRWCTQTQKQVVESKNNFAKSPTFNKCAERYRALQERMKRRRNPDAGLGSVRESEFRHTPK